MSLAQAFLWAFVLMAGGDPAELDSRARSEFQAGNFRRAQALFTEVVASLPANSPGLAAAHYNLGRACLGLGEHGRAEREYRLALRFDPKAYVVSQALGDLLFLKGDYRAAEAIQRSVIEAAVADRNRTVEVSARNSLALVLDVQGKHKEALDLLLSVLPESNPGQARARLLANIGSVSWRLGLKDHSLSFLSKALQEMEAAAGQGHPDLIRILEDYATVLGRTGRKQEARIASERAANIRSAFALQANTAGATVDWRDMK